METTNSLNSTRSFSTIKLFRACNFCRKRKVKCVIHCSTICENCKAHNEQCVFEHKKVLSGKDGGQHIKKTQKSKHNSKHSTSCEVKTIEEDVEDIKSRDNYQLPLFLPDLYSISIDELRTIYETNVEPHTPFISKDLFSGLSGIFDDFCKICIIIAAKLNPNTDTIPDIEEISEFCNSFLTISPINWNACSLSCFFLLPLKINIKYEIINNVLNTFETLYSKDYNIVQDSLLLGVFATDSWISFIHSKPRIMKSISEERIYNIIINMDKTFPHFFLYVAYFLNKVMNITECENKDLNELKEYILQLEFDMLLWPAKLNGELCLVEDNYTAKPEAKILHIVHNVLLLSYYTIPIENDKIGQLCSISPVPGLYYFLCNMADSNFVIYQNIHFKWNLLDDCNILVAKLLVCLNSYMDFDFLKNALRKFDAINNMSHLACKSETLKDVRNILAHSSYYNFDVDGALIYWMFRDIRSMSLQSYNNNHK